MTKLLPAVATVLFLAASLPASAGEPEAAAFNTGKVNPFAESRRPISNPVYFDLTIPQTQIRPLFLYHNLPDKMNTTLGDLPVGGDVQLYALQIEIALTDRLSINAVKDGYIDMNPDMTLSDADGWANLAAGLKYAWLLRPEKGLASNVQLLFEAPTGNSDVFQGEGDGVFIPSASVMKLWGRWQIVDQLGFKIPVDSDAESSSMFNSFHASYAILDWFFPTFEVNWWHVLDAGSGQANFPDQVGGAVPAVIEFEGNDLLNFGAVNAERNRDLVTFGVGFRARIPQLDNVDIGFAYEFPVTDEEDSIFDDRFIVDAVIRF